MTGGPQHLRAALRRVPQHSGVRLGDGEQPEFQGGDDSEAAAAAAQRPEAWGRCLDAAPPRSWTWLQAIAYWAQVAAAVGVPDPGWLYDQLEPHAGELAVVGVGADCGGAVDSLLAGLAWRLGRLDVAAERAEAGLALETRAGSAVWITRTKNLIDRIGAAEAPAHYAGDMPDARGTAGYS